MSNSFASRLGMALLAGFFVCGPVLAGQAAEAPVAAADAAGPTLSVEQLTPLCFGPEASRPWRPYRADLAPAQWIWLPSERTLSNTFVLFRKEITLTERPTRATGWITADSRYCLWVNGKRVQWGPAPCDPRQVDVDPFDITPLLQPGKNVLGVEVLFYGLGDGTWPAGKPGLLLHAVLEGADGKTQRIVSDASWQCTVDRAHPAGQAKRWFLRALQEELDARLFLEGWNTSSFVPDDRWTTAMVLQCPADKPASCSKYPQNDGMDYTDKARSALRGRQIPLTEEREVPVLRLADSGRVMWRRDPRDWFEFRMPDSFELKREAVAEEIQPGVWRLPATTERAAVYATFELREQVVGFPHFEIDAPAGTIVELMTQESHDPKATAWLDTQFFAWSRLICREGLNRFEPFDFESLRWMQLHIRNASRPVTVRQVGVRRRLFAWPHEPRVRCSEPALQRLVDASINTLRNSALETVVDGMARERQQYSGDGGHQLIAIRTVMGDTLLSRRFLRTFSEGQSPDGYFLDCWPAFDRLARVTQKQIDGARWGPILDHGVGFNFDCWKHYLETGDRDAVAEAYPRLLRFAGYLEKLRDADGLLPVENLGIPTVWIDHSAYRRQRDKQCAFNLYASAMFCHALAPLAEAFDDPQRAVALRCTGESLLEATRRRYWSEAEGLFVDNLPWAAEDQEIRTSDRTLAMSLLFDQCPDAHTAAAARELAEGPKRMGISYPCNACWRYWALAQVGRTEVILHDFRTRWATMRSVLDNNTIQENWQAKSDSTAQWSHCAVAPLFVLAQDIAGIRPLTPGYARCQIRPQLADLKELELVVHTPHGPIHFHGQSTPEGQRVSLTIPDGVQAELLAPADSANGQRRMELKSGQTNQVLLKSIGK